MKLFWAKTGGGGGGGGGPFSCFRKIPHKGPPFENYFGQKWGGGWGVHFPILGKSQYL